MEKKIGMINHFEHKSNKYSFKRYPETTNRSLKAWNAGQEHILQYLEELNLEDKNILVVGDRFGFLPIILNSEKAHLLLDYKSQAKAYSLNADLNSVKEYVVYPNYFDNVSIALMVMPKSIDLLDNYLHQIHSALDSNGEVVISFMTKYFTSSMIDVCKKYFDNVEQSKAYKKSRLFILKEPKSDAKSLELNRMVFDGVEYSQIKGVFSAKHIDYATEFLLHNYDWSIMNGNVVDLASGNGIIASYISKHTNGITEINLVDDFYYAVESGKLNCANSLFVHSWNDGLDHIENGSTEFVVTNPPFHIDNENNIEVALRLFKESHLKLKEGGKLIIVANKHLNYFTHLEDIYNRVEIIKENDRFIIYECLK